MRRDLCALALAAREAEITLGYLRHEARDDNPGADARRGAMEALPEAERVCRHRLLELADAVEDGLDDLGDPALAEEEPAGEGDERVADHTTSEGQEAGWAKRRE